ncbi:uncharacterized protein LOC131623948 isoform X1 [Vicia villosa]|uniref:uncharacterized protein LOC131623948 isoform X1 n=1 Tax=Vicia villosa TaxID=3911 RepID=UPI00273B3DF7|nr:uncharacterized protein LOC131623948 isoform X1 [Vicia villosa]
MEFHGLPRKELQALCKRNKIPANMTNVAMADALAALPQVEGLGEIMNPKEGVDIGTPAVQPRTAGRATTQRKPVKESESSKISTRPNRGARSGVAEGEVEQENKNANVPVTTPAVVPCTRRRGPAVSTRGKKEVIILDDDEEDDKNEVDEKTKDVPAKTPAVAPKSRTRAAGRSVRDKKDVSAGTSLQNAYSTRRSVRVLGKSLSKVSLVETEDKEQTKSEDVSEDGTSLQTESNGVSRNNDEVEVSSVNKAESETKSHDSGSEEKSSDAEDVLQAEPEVEGSENVNQVEAHENLGLNLEDSFETCVDSKEAESEQPDLEESGNADGTENKESFGAKQDQTMEFAAPEETPLEVTDQAIGDTAEIENKETFGAKQDQANEFVAPEEAPLEVADQGIDASTDVVSGDISMEVADQKEVAGLSVEASEEAFKGTAEQATVGLSVEASEEASKEISHQVIASSTDLVSDDSKEVSHQEEVADLSVEASEEIPKETAEQAFVGLSFESSEEASKEISHQAIASSTDAVFNDASNEVSAEVSEVAFKEIAELATTEVSEVSLESFEKASQESSHQAIAPLDVVVADDACVDNLDEGVADMVVEEVENVEGAVSAILAEKDETSGRAEDEGEKESSDVEKVILELSMMDVSSKKEADQNNTSQKLEVAQAEELGTEGHAELEDESEKESNSVEKVTLKLSMMDVSAKKEADLNNTSQKLEVAQADVLATEENPELEAVVQTNDEKTNESVAVEQIMEEPICSPQLETKEKLKTIQDMSVRRLRKLLKSGTREISNEFQAVTSVDSDMNKQVLKSGTQEISNEIQAVTSVDSDMNKQLLESGAKEISNEIQAVASVESDVNNPNAKKENSKTIDVQNMSMRGLKKLLKEKLDGKLAMSDNDDVQMQGVEKKRTALQALPQNQLAEKKAAY